MKNLMTVATFISMLCGYLYYEVNFTKFCIENVETDKIQDKEKIKILQISDVHNKRVKKKILNTIKELNPDIIVITGDLIDWKTKDAERVYGFVEKLVMINPNVYFVSGNHEWRNKYIKNFIDGLSKRGVMVLNNKNTTFTKKSITINICGIDDAYSDHHNVGKALVGRNKKLFTLLLSHAPDIVYKEKNVDVDLMLCGHTHGGQVRLPFIGAIIAPGQGFFPKYDQGIFKVWKNTIMYIDSGFGNSRLPLRFLDRSQMSLIEVKGKKGER